MKNYIVVDVETCNRERNICSISVLEIKDHKIANTFYSLINPNNYFEKTNIRINGIDEEMVKDAPTFDKFYPSIEKLLHEEVFIMHGGNHFDMDAISKDLSRYNLEVPKFRYLDTCDIAKECIDLEDYSLPTVAAYLGLESFDHHNALEDTIATYKVFEYFNSLYELEPSDYVFAPVTKISWGRQERNAISNLVGIINGINADGVINADEMLELSTWLDTAQAFHNHVLFKIVIELIEGILSDGVVDENERKKLERLSLLFEGGEKNTFNIDQVLVLQGILEGIIADQKLNLEEVKVLEEWLENSSIAEDHFACRELQEKIHKILEDGVITKEEEIELSELIDFIINPVKETSKFSLSDIEGKTFSYTQQFAKFNPREKLADILIAAGGKKTGINMKLDYLFVGSITNDRNSYGQYGKNVLQVMENIKKGAHTIIVNEEDLPLDLL